MHGTKVKGYSSVLNEGAIAPVEDNYKLKSWLGRINIAKSWSTYLISITPGCKIKVLTVDEAPRC
jgi:hypothetical protein